MFLKSNAPQPFEEIEEALCFAEEIRVRNYIDILLLLQALKFARKSSFFVTFFNIDKTTFCDDPKMYQRGSYIYNVQVIGVLKCTGCFQSLLKSMFTNARQVH